MKQYIAIVFVLLIQTALIAQVLPNHTTAEQRVLDFNLAKKLEDSSIYKNITASSIGPAIFSGRVVDLAVNPEDPSIFYVAYASGGLWKTESNGTRFKAIFDNEALITIGAIAVDWENERIWLGSGEVNSSRSSYAGNGVYMSEDDGETWNHMGLDDTHHIGRIIVDPERKNRVYVAALGHLYTDNMERGVYITDDTGESWKQSLSIGNKTGAVDLVQDPNKPNTLYASMWQRKRFAWNFIEAGVGSGIYKSSDRGDNWTHISGDESGLPNGEGLGRIGLAVTSNKNSTIIYSIIDNYNRRPDKEKADDKKLSKDRLKEMSLSEFNKLSDEDLKTYLKTNRFPKEYTTDVIRTLVDNEEVQVSDLALYLVDANRLLFDTPVIGAEVYVSKNEGQSWTKTHDGYLDHLYNSYGYYFGQIRVNPLNSRDVYIMGVPILRSIDGGQNFSNVNGSNVHVDHHALWINPKRNGHIINGNDGGVNISYDSGESWFKCNNPPVGQFYTVNVDLSNPYNIYGGTQDNGVWYGNKNYKASDRWQNYGNYPYKSIIGGDGMQIQIDSRDNNTIYTGYQFGNYYRINKQTGERKNITPKHKLGVSPYRWNWQSPIHLSIHNQDILYMGANLVLRSMDQGNNFEEISHDLSNGGKKGDVPYGTISSLHESPLKFGLLYTGSDDGRVFVSKNGGYSWNDIQLGLPQDMWVSRIQASYHDEASVYISLNGYRWDNFNSMVYKSSNYGSDWEQIGLNIPNEPINVIKEDPINKDLLYIGTDHNLYISVNGGLSFYPIACNLPTVPVHDLVIHPREGDLVVGTHGRSIYVINMDGIRAWINAGKSEDKTQILNKPEIVFSETWGKRRNAYSEFKAPRLLFDLYVRESASYEITIKNDDKKTVQSIAQELTKGFNSFEYDLSITENRLKHFPKDKRPSIKENGLFYLSPGNYTIEIDGVSSDFYIKTKD